jgi:hypothetical protein
LFLFFLKKKRKRFHAGQSIFLPLKPSSCHPKKKKEKGIRGTSQSPQLVFLASFTAAPIHFHKAEEKSIARGQTAVELASIQRTRCLANFRRTLFHSVEYVAYERGFLPHNCA